jgi:hypothetical protein
MPPWKAIASEDVDDPTAEHKNVVRAWLVTLRDEATGTEHNGRVELFDSATRMTGLSDKLVSTHGEAGFVPFLDDLQPPLLVYVTADGILVPEDGVYEGFERPG